MPMPEGHTDPAKAEVAFTAPLPIYVCQACRVVQTLHDIDLSDYYTDYRYTVSRSKFVQDFMQCFAERVWRTFDFAEEDVVLEVGSSDGFQLKCFQQLGGHVLGFEPSETLAAAARASGVDTVQALFTREALDLIPSAMRPVQAVVIQYTFDHLPDPVGFLEAVREILDPQRGVVVIEVHDFEKIVERREACLFCHEHATYLSVDSLEAVLNQAGFVTARADLVPEDKRRGNSLIVAGTPASSRVPRVAPPRSELLDSLQQREPYDQFARDVIRSHGRLAAHVREMHAQGHTVAGYGAAARGVNTLTIAGLDGELIKCVYDMNPQLQGLELPGLGIPVPPPEQLLHDAIDEVIVFRYGYLEEIRQTYASYLNAGGRIVSMLEYLSSESNDRSTV